MSSPIVGGASTYALQSRTLNPAASGTSPPLPINALLAQYAPAMYSTPDALRGSLDFTNLSFAEHLNGTPAPTPQQSTIPPGAYPLPEAPPSSPTQSEVPATQPAQAPKAPPATQPPPASKAPQTPETPDTQEPQHPQSHQHPHPKKSKRHHHGLAGFFQHLFQRFHTKGKEHHHHPLQHKQS